MGLIPASPGVYVGFFYFELSAAARSQIKELWSDLMEFLFTAFWCFQINDTDIDEQEHDQGFSHSDLVLTRTLYDEFSTWCVCDLLVWKVKGSRSLMSNLFKPGEQIVKQNHRQYWHLSRLIWGKGSFIDNADPAPTPRSRLLFLWWLVALKVFTNQQKPNSSPVWSDLYIQLKRWVVVHEKKTPQPPEDAFDGLPPCWAKASWSSLRLIILRKQIITVNLTWRPTYIFTVKTLIRS